MRPQGFMWSIEMRAAVKKDREEPQRHISRKQEPDNSSTLSVVQTLTDEETEAETETVAETLSLAETKTTTATDTSAEAMAVTGNPSLGVKRNMLPGNTAFNVEMSVRTEKLPFGAVVVRQGDPVIGLHFITRGQAQAVVEPAMHRHQYPRLWDRAHSALARELGRNYFKKEEKVKESLQMEHIRVRRLHGYAAAERRLAEKRVPLCTVETGEVIGDVEYVLGLDTYHQTVVCSSAAEVLVLDSRNVERVLLKKNQAALDIMRDQVEEKLTSRMNLLQNSHIGLLEVLLSKLRDMNAKKNGVSNDKATQTSQQDVMMKQLVKLFLQDKSPLVIPCVPNTLFYKSKACERARRELVASIRQRNARSKSLPAEVRLQRARRSSTRKPRSRRELERLHYGQSEDGGEISVSRLEDSSTLLTDSRPETGLKSRSVSMYGHQGELESTENIFRLTETPQLVKDDEQLTRVNNWTSSVTNNVSLEQVSINMEESSKVKNDSRSRLVCDLLTQGLPEAAARDLFPSGSSASNQKQGYYEDEEEDEPVFDWETSDDVLSGLEAKIQAFNQKYDAESDRPNSRTDVVQLRRFRVKTPEDVPLAGGTVYVRQRPCQYPPGASIESAHHKHVRRFVMPRNAYSLATHSLEQLGLGPVDRAPHPPTLTRPHTAAVLGSPSSSTTSAVPLHRAKSASAPRTPALLGI